MDLKVPVFSTKGSDFSHMYQCFLEQIKSSSAPFAIEKDPINVFF